MLGTQPPSFYPHTPPAIFYSSSYFIFFLFMIAFPDSIATLRQQILCDEDDLTPLFASQTSLSQMGMGL